MVNKLSIVDGAHVVVPLTPEEEADAAMRSAVERSIEQKRFYEAPPSPCAMLKWAAANLQPWHKEN